MSHTGISRAVSRAVKAGKLRKLASRLYTRNLDDAPEAVVRRNLWGIVAGYFPGALIADRTAFEAAPASDGSLCLVSERGRTVELPGVVLRPRRGPERVASDMPFVEGLYLSSRTRAYLENMRPSRARGTRRPRTLGRAEIEKRLDLLIRTAGEGAARQLRDDVRAIALELGLEQEAAQLDTLIGTLLGTRRSRMDSPVAIARSRGRPYDPDRMELFHRLHQALRNRPPGVRPAPPRNPRGRAHRVRGSRSGPRHPERGIRPIPQSRVPLRTGRLHDVPRQRGTPVRRRQRTTRAYLAALRALSRTGRADPLIRVLDYAQRWTLALDWSSLEAAERELQRCNAFLDSDEAEAMGKRLRMPG